MVTPIKYRSIFTGQEIDEAIAAMKGSLSADLIVNDYSGGTGKIASAELAKTLKTNIDANFLPANLKTQLLLALDTHTLTDVEYSRITYLNATKSFRGSFANAADRDAAVATETSSYIGNEISFIADDGSTENLPEFSKWDTASSTWKKVKLSNEAVGSFPQIVAAAGTLNLFSFKANRFSAAKCLIVASNSSGTQKQVLEGLITHINGDTYLSVYNEIGNVTGLFNIVSQYVYGSNNLIKTQDFASNTWASNGGVGTALAIQDNCAIAPDGTLTAATLLETASNNYHRIGYDLTLAGSVTSQRRFSIYAKANGRTKARGWSWSQADSSQQSFDLTGNGTATGTQSPAIQAVGNGWYRCSFLIPANQANNVVFAPSDGTGGTNMYMGVNGQGIQVWGAQLEVGTVASAYVPPVVNVNVQTLAANLTISGKMLALI